MHILLEQFTGLAPKYSIRQLKPNWASAATNAQLYSGELRGLRTPLLIQSLQSTTKSAFRLFNTNTFVEFPDKETHLIRGQVVNDTDDRYYWSDGDSAPRFAIQTKLSEHPTDPNNNNNSFKLGVPAPSVAPVINCTGGDGVKETRVYVYTFVNEFGEESAPSPPSDPTTNFINAGWEVTDMSTTYGLTRYADLEAIRIYRSISGLSSVNYRFVVEVDQTAAAEDTYDDTFTPDEVALNDPLETLIYELPPDGLDGLINMPNGMMVGYVGKDIYVSEPYRPHAWPSNYIITVDADIIGLGVHQSGLVVCTNSNPYVVSGTTPLNLTSIKLDEVEPCKSRYSIASAQTGVYYASQNGLVLVNEYQAQVITKPIITRNEWRERYLPDQIEGAVLGTSYIGFFSESQGFIYGPDSGESPLVDLGNISLLERVQHDPFSAEVYLIQDSVLFQWNPSDTAPYTYSWMSKEFVTPRPVNFGTIMVRWEEVEGASDFEPGIDYTVYNDYRLDAGVDDGSQYMYGLNPLNFAPLNQVPHADTGKGPIPASIDWPATASDYPDWAINPVDFDPFTDLPNDPYPYEVKTDAFGSAIRSYSPLSIFDGVLIRIWGDRVLRYENVLLDEKPHRLPSGYKASVWKIELQSSSNVFSTAIAETGKELTQL